MRYMVLCVSMTEWSWLEDILDDEGLPTGRKQRKYGIFWEWLHNNIDPTVITPSFEYLTSEQPKIMIKDGTEWGVEIIPIDRFNVPDYDSWATRMLTDAITTGITIIADTVEAVDKKQWFKDNGFEEREGG